MELYFFFSILFFLLLGIGILKERDRGIVVHAYERGSDKKSPDSALKETANLSRTDVNYVKKVIADAGETVDTVTDIYILPRGFIEVAGKNVPGRKNVINKNYAEIKLAYGSEQEHKQGKVVNTLMKQYKKKVNSQFSKMFGKKPLFGGGDFTTAQKEKILKSGKYEGKTKEQLLGMRDSLKNDKKEFDKNQKSDEINYDNLQKLIDKEEFLTEIEKGQVYDTIDDKVESFTYDDIEKDTSHILKERAEKTGIKDEFDKKLTAELAENIHKTEQVKGLISDAKGGVWENRKGFNAYKKDTKEEHENPKKIISPSDDTDWEKQTDSEAYKNKLDNIESRLDEALNDINKNIVDDFKDALGYAREYGIDEKKIMELLEKEAEKADIFSRDRLFLVYEELKKDPDIKASGNITKLFGGVLKTIENTDRKYIENKIDDIFDDFASKLDKTDYKDNEEIKIGTLVSSILNTENSTGMVENVVNKTLVATLYSDLKNLDNVGDAINVGVFKQWLKDGNGEEFVDSVKGGILDIVEKSFKEHEAVHGIIQKSRPEVSSGDDDTIHDFMSNIHTPFNTDDADKNVSKINSMNNAREFIKVNDILDTELNADGIKNVYETFRKESEKSNKDSDGINLKGFKNLLLKEKIKKNQS